MPHLHSIYLTDEAADPARLPWPIASNIQSFRFYHPGFTHQLYRNENARAFIEEHFDRDVLAAYDELVPYSYKSDLLRYCLLFQLGGVYADVSMHFFSPLERAPGGQSIKLFRDLFSQAPWIIGTSLIYSPPRMELFENCIRKIVQNVETGYYGYNPLCPTGPHLLGAQVAEWGKLDAMILGEACSIARTHGGSFAGISYLSADHQLVGVINKTRRGLAQLGSSTRNSYTDFYFRRKIYRRELDRPDVWTHRDYRQRHLMNALAEIDENSGRYLFRQGCALHGPRVGLEAGDYNARFMFGADNTSDLGVAIDVIADGRQIASPVLVPPVESGEGVEYSLPFSLARHHDNVEIRLHLNSRRELSFDRMELVTISGSQPA